MKKILTLITFCLLTGAFQVEAGPHFYASTRKKSHSHFEVDYKAKNGLSPQEFLQAKMKTDGVIKSLTDLAFLPVRSKITITFDLINIEPGGYSRGSSDIVINPESTIQDIKDSILPFFYLPSKVDSVQYYPINSPSFELFMTGVNKVEGRLNFFKNGKLPLALPYGFKVKISPVKMKGGSIFLKDDTLVLVPTVTDFNVELLLARFVNVPRRD